MEANKWEKMMGVNNGKQNDRRKYRETYGSDRNEYCRSIGECMMWRMGNKN